MGVHNGADSLDVAIGSIVGQTFEAWELIVVDDGSDDASLEIAHSWARRDARVHVVVQWPNAGHPASLNEAFRRSRGELIARMDADDESFPERLEKQVRFLDAHPEVTVVGTGAEFVDPRGSVIGTGLLLEAHDDIVSKIYRTSPFIHPSVMMRRTFLEELGGYDVRLRRAEDVDLWLRGCRRFRYHNIAEPLIRCRTRERGGVTARTMLEGAFVLARSAYRERHLLSRGGYAVRYLGSTFLVSLGLRRRRLPQAPPSP